MYWLMAGNLGLSADSKVFIQKIILNTIWTYGIQHTENASTPGIIIILAIYNGTLRNIKYTMAYNKC